MVVKLREIILSAFTELQEGDVRVNPASCPGEDIWLSPAARILVPLAIECKNCETVRAWDWIDQAKSYAKDGRCPVVIFSRNREPEPYAIISAKDLIYLIKGADNGLG